VKHCGYIPVLCLMAWAFALAAADSVFAASRGLAVELRSSETKGAPTAGSVKLYGTSHALVIGNDAYGGAWPRLSNAVKDARLVADALIAKGFDVTLKTNLRSGELVEALEDFFYEVGEDPEARLFLWYAGHGHSERGEGYLVPVDAPNPSEGGAFRRKALSLRRMGEYVRSTDARHVLAVFDSCFAGTIFNVGRAKPPPAITHATTRLVRQFLTSGDAGQEVSDDGTFRKLFLRAINGETNVDANHDGYVVASELGLFMSSEITNYSNGSQTPRNGKLNDPDFNQGDFVFKVASVVPVRVAAPAVQTKPSVQNRVDKEALFWESIKDSQRVSDYEAYVLQFPNGAFVHLARSRALALKTKQVASLKPPPLRVEEVDASYVALQSATVRSSPSSNSSKVGALERDVPIMVTGKVGDGAWLRVEQAGGETGYVFAKLFAPVDAGEVSAWTRIKDTKSADAVSVFLRRYPSGHFHNRALALMASLSPTRISKLRDGRSIWKGTEWISKDGDLELHMKFGGAGDSYSANLQVDEILILTCSGKVEPSGQLLISNCSGAYGNCDREISGAVYEIALEPAPDNRCEQGDEKLFEIIELWEAMRAFSAKSN
jgi:hypothetical protein